MTTSPAPAPYHSRCQYLPLRFYRSRDLSVFQWAEEQFELEISTGLAGDSEFHRRSAATVELMDQLPLQAKDLFRGLIDRLRLQPADDFEVDELGVWRPGEVRINCDPARVAELQGWPSDGAQVRQLLQTTLIHECGHALLEDPRGGVSLRSFMHLLVVSGWLPNPLHDPVPFQQPVVDPAQLTEHLLKRLREVDSRWDADQPVRAPGQPPPVRLDTDLMGDGRTWQAGRERPAPTLGLRSPRQLGKELLTQRARGTLYAELRSVGLSADQVWRVASRYRPVTSCAEDLISEAPAEIFRQLHRGPVPWRAAQTAMQEGERLLIQPWRDAELVRGRSEPAPRPNLKRHLVPGRA